MNIANKLTVLRVIMIPLFLFAFWSPLFGGYGRYIAAGVFILASLTDLFDGMLARKYNLITNFGKFMDPLADKLLVCAALIALVETGDIKAWFVIIIVCREFIVTGVRLVAAEQNIVIAADKLAKLKTVTQIITVIFFVLELQKINSVFEIAGGVLIVFTVLLTVVSAYGYISKNLSLFRGEI